MSESLSLLADRVAKQAERLLTHQKSATLLGDLSERQSQLHTLNGDLENLQTASSLLLEVDPKLRVPRKRLSPRLKNLRKLQEKVTIDPLVILPAEALDVAGLEEATEEIRKALLKRWCEFAKPERAAQGLETLGDDTTVSNTVRQLQTTRSELEEWQASLPAKKSEVEDVRKLKKRLEELADQLIAHGYDEAILSFITKAREPRGTAIAEVLNNPKVRKWLEDNRHASRFRIVHESVLSSGPIYRR
jgi:hypothetical protein